MRPHVRRLVLGGLAGTLARTVMMYGVAPMMGAGLFSAAAGGMLAAAGSLVGHLLYGTILGTVGVARTDLQLAPA